MPRKKSQISNLKSQSGDAVSRDFAAAIATVDKGAFAPATAADLIPHVRILNVEETDLSPMESWPLTVSLLTEFWPRNRRTVILKPRQMGVSWAFALYCLHHCGWTPYRVIGSLNYTREAAAELIRRMRVLWSTLSDNLRPRAEWAVEHVEFANGSRVVSLATKDIAGAGLTFSIVGIDEAGLVAGLEDIWASVLPAVDKGQLHIFSTARGDSNKFAKLVQAARGGDKTFRLWHIHWSERPDRDQATEQGRAWLAARKTELSEREFAREYEGEFTRPGSAYFDDETIKRIRAACAAPAEVQMRGHLALWLPTKEITRRLRAGETFCIGADVAEGLEDGDFSAAIVLNRRTGEQVAAYHAHVGVTDYAEDLVSLAKIFGKAWLAIEANNHGHAVCAWVYRHLRYRKVYRESTAGEGGLAAPRARLGVLTTSSSKPAMLAAVEDGVRRGGIIVRDAGLAEELSTYLCLADGEYGAAPGSHDDRVTGLMLAQYGRSRPTPRCA